MYFANEGKPGKGETADEPVPVIKSRLERAGEMDLKKAADTAPLKELLC